jgi:hypothetical protein
LTVKLVVVRTTMPNIDTENWNKNKILLFQSRVVKMSTKIKIILNVRAIKHTIGAIKHTVYSCLHFLLFLIYFHYRQFTLVNPAENNVSLQKKVSWILNKNYQKNKMCSFLTMVENSSNVYSKYQDFYRIGGVMVSVFVSSVQVKPKTIKIGVCCFMLNTQH